ncbi:hypothetical protein MNBD_GAMMA12-3259 [hydrothermal vent metagenome]|uniref:Uncharacterized protein n=1 Tax=hydrothermal vent metagenome TaxID=652676 RepID=A0A3B0YGM8_9ZZZZ
MNSNYTPPQSDVVAENLSREVSNSVLASLGSTKPWALFIGIVIILVSLLTFIRLFSMMVLPVKMLALPGSIGSLVFVMMLMTGLFGISLMLMGIYLIKYSSSIGRLLVSRDAGDLDSSILAQKKFWTLAGIVTLVAVILVVILIILAISNTP